MVGSVLRSDTSRAAPWVEPETDPDEIELEVMMAAAADHTALSAHRGAPSAGCSPFV